MTRPKAVAVATIVYRQRRCRFGRTRPAETEIIDFNLTDETIVQGDGGAKGVKTSTATVGQIATNITNIATLSGDIETKPRIKLPRISSNLNTPNT